MNNQTVEARIGKTLRTFHESKTTLLLRIWMVGSYAAAFVVLCIVLFTDIIYPIPDKTFLAIARSIPLSIVVIGVFITTISIVPLSRVVELHEHGIIFQFILWKQIIHKDTIKSVQQMNNGVFTGRKHMILQLRNQHMLNRFRGFLDEPAYQMALQFRRINIPIVKWWFLIDLD